MRDTLEQLQASWIRDDLKRRVGFSFLCPECNDGHRLSVLFALPLDGAEPKTMGFGVVLGHRGEDLHMLSTDGGFRHGDLWVFVEQGDVVTG